MIRFEFDNEGYVSCILYGCYTGSCYEYSGLVPSEPEAYEDMDDWANRAQVQAYYLNAAGNLSYDAERAAKIPDDDYVEVQPYTQEHAKKLGIFDLIYPVGSLYMSINDVSPAELFGGTWERIEDKFILASGMMYASGDEGGTSTHKHIAPIGYESSSQYLGTVNVNGTTTSYSTVGGYNSVKRDAGGGTVPSGIAAYYTQDESHIPPYIAVNVWQRVNDPVPEKYENFIDANSKTIFDAHEEEFMVEVG